MVAEVGLSLFVTVCTSGAFLVGFMASLTLVDTPGLFVDREFFLNCYLTSLTFFDMPEFTVYRGTFDGDDDDHGADREDGSSPHTFTSFR